MSLIDGRHQLCLPLEGNASVDPKSHYDHDPVGAVRGLAGAGPLAFITGDELHPPMVDDEWMWQEGRWHDGARRHTLDAARLCGLRSGGRVLDIGCGIGGPARTLVDAFDVNVLAISVSETQVDTAAQINATNPRWSRHIDVAVHDCQWAYAQRNFDVAWSMNMLYHVESKERMLRAAYDALRPGGRLLIDDWMLTPRASDDDRAVLQSHFVSPHFAVREELVAMIADLGYSVTRIQDLGHIGRTHLRAYFPSVFDRVFRKLFVECDPEYGPQMADDFYAGILETIRMYTAETLTYFRVVATK